MSPGPARLLAGGLALLLASGCSFNPPLQLADIADSEEPVELSDVPLHIQQDHHCGPASLLTLLEASGIPATYDSVVERVYVPGLEGSLQIEMLAATRSFERVAYTLPAEPSAVVAQLEQDRPVLVLLNLGFPRAPVWHYAVVVGFDPGRNRIVLHSGTDERTQQKARPWLRRWDWAGRWAMVALRPGEWPAAVDKALMLRALASFEDSAGPQAAGLSWRTAAEHWPDEPLVWLGVGNAAYRLEDWKGALEAYRKVLEEEPTHIPAQLNLALALAAVGRPCDGLAVLADPPREDHPLTLKYEEVTRQIQTGCDSP